MRRRFPSGRTPTVSRCPVTFVHGGYSRETTIMGGTPVPNEDLVNLPNWAVLAKDFGQFRMPTAREMMRPSVTNEIRACVLISAFACREIGIVSAGLNALAVVTPSAK